MTLFHWQPTPHQYYHGFWVNLFQNPKEPIFTQIDAKPLVQNLWRYYIIKAHVSNLWNISVSAYDLS